MGIPTRNEINYRVQNVYLEKYPQIENWPSDPSEVNLPKEVWCEFSDDLESSYRAREALWLEKIIAMDKWPLLFICGADHFTHFRKLLESSQIRVTELCKHWDPDKNEL